ncbi:hypothetical protein Vafri_20442, partial [Volvox africanus]
PPPAADTALPLPGAGNPARGLACKSAVRPLPPSGNTPSWRAALALVFASLVLPSIRSGSAAGVRCCTRRPTCEQIVSICCRSPCCPYSWSACETVRTMAAMHRGKDGKTDGRTTGRRSRPVSSRAITRWQSLCLTLSHTLSSQIGQPTFKANGKALFRV